MYYEGAKYVRYCFRYYAKEELPEKINHIEFTRYKIENGIMVPIDKSKNTIELYLIKYFNFVRDSQEYENPSNIIFASPCNAVYQSVNREDEREYCVSCAELMRYLCVEIRAQKDIYNVDDDSQAMEISPKYFEDLYYCALYELYLTFGMDI